jgi:hypothetical protein
MKGNWYLMRPEIEMKKRRASSRVIRRVHTYRSCKRSRGRIVDRKRGRRE